MSRFTQGRSDNSTRFRGPHLLTTRIVDDLHDRSSERNSGTDKRAQAFPRLLSRNVFVGRQSQLHVLEDTFQRIGLSHRSEAVIIRGHSGVGKTCIVNKFFNTLSPKVLCARGKFDHLHSRSPFSALVSISEHLCRQVLRQENSNDIRDKIRAVLGSEVSLLGNFIPALFAMNTDGLHLNESASDCQIRSSNRFKQLFRSFLRCVASEENPVVLFLDDIQWADIASMEVLESILSDDLSHDTFFIFAHREGDDGIKFLHTLCYADVKNRFLGKKCCLTEVNVEKLERFELNEMISRILCLEEIETLSLSSLIWKKTDGNPFYAIHFLDMLYSKGMLLRQVDGSWAWDEKRILQQTNVADNLAHILEVKLNQIPSQARSILQIASFVGYEFSANILTIILVEEQDMIEGTYSFNRHSMESIQKRVESALMIATDQGLLETMPGSNEAMYKFAHDKVRHVLYEDLMPDLGERQRLHQRIGILLCEALKGRHERREFHDFSVFLAANNLNQALDLVDSVDGACDTIKLNLSAGKAAMKKSDFPLAADYLRIAVKLLESHPFWDSHYQLCTEVLCTAAEIEMIVANYERNDALLSELFQRAKCFQHKCAAYQVQLTCLAGKGEIKASVYLGLEILRNLSVRFPRKINVISVVKEYFRAKVALRGRPLASLIELPELRDQKRIYILSFMDTVLENSFLLGDSFKEVFAFFALRTFRLIMEYGLSSRHTPMAVLNWGTFQAAMGAFDKALEANQVALAIIEKFKNEAIRGRAMLTAYGTILFWRKKLDKDCANEIMKGYHLAMAFGDTFFGQFGIVGWIVAKIYLDDPLSDVHPRMRALVADMKDDNANRALILILPNWQFALNLCDDSGNSDPSILRGEAMDDSFASEVENIDSKIALFRLNLNEMMAAYLFGNWDIVSSALSFFKQHEQTLAGVFPADFSHFWAALCYYDLFLETGIVKYKKEGQRAHRKVKTWADSGTEILVAPNLVLEAMATILKKGLSLETIELSFKAAIEACQKAKIVIFEALTTERLAKHFFINSSNQTKGIEYHERAVSVYRKWGALKKASWLDDLRLTSLMKHQ